MALLHDILWNPDNKDVETALADKARPPTAGEEWDPAEDGFFQKFIARVQAAREANGVFTSGGEEGRERWNEVLRLAEFDKEEWSEYLQEQRADRCISELEEWIDEGDSKITPGSWIEEN